MSQTDSKQNDLFVRPIYHIDEKIRQPRKTLSMNQAKLAQHLDVPSQQIFKYEKGVDKISTEKLLELSKILTVNLNFFYMELNEFSAPQTSLVIVCKSEEGKQFSLKLLGDDHIFSEITVVERDFRSNLAEKKEN